MRTVNLMRGSPREVRRNRFNGFWTEPRKEKSKLGEGEEIASMAKSEDEGSSLD